MLEYVVTSSGVLGKPRITAREYISNRIKVEIAGFGVGFREERWKSSLSTSSQPVLLVENVDILFPYVLLADGELLSLKQYGSEIRVKYRTYEYQLSHDDRDWRLRNIIPHYISYPGEYDYLEVGDYY